MSASLSPPRDKRSLDYAIRSGIAGGVAGCVAKTVVAPLDRVKILFQASNPDFQKYAGTWSGAYRAGLAIYKDGGARGLLQGHSATLLRIFPYAAIKFMAYDHWRPLLMPDKAHETNFRRFAAGALAGMTSVIFTYPLELIRVRMAFQNHTQTHRPTFLSAMSHIYHESAVPSSSTASPSSSSSSAPSSSRATPPSSTAMTPPSKHLFQRLPILKFYRGFTVTMVGMIPYAGTAFLTWDFLRAYFYPSHSRSPSSHTNTDLRPTPLANLAIGAVTGVLSQTASYPFEVVRRRMQVGGLTRPERWLRWGETVRTVYSNGGWRGFYVGLGIGYLKIVPMTAVSFMVWQWGKGVLGV
ncbi:mitochondrial carrier [Leucogyrophana mollusca]|uniref:Mitochondrial carrier n=1 Tax=Leucogyrophana mollusca TaxID=85980 RepID=A0ACB8BL98_9AGAM|nr:mitochondrial carrier [Leucogyrophana mollusca]